ncbi:hypothetical protein WOLCODRAFT_155555 [Wolfiporia cocos MD-104 SS10]|uniref:Uncharacterized protein n=1 Tax=Wolfiporia cocos (strain MD-104) TaxID=742152 RepID=A0A2H3IY45_WOLCO|nr:hypothetical protein WOLCODRAFT_155555 [Wolfiporia cocos MD-104 SS10]
MSASDSPFRLLQQTISKSRAKNRKNLAEALEKVSSHLVLLNSSTISEQSSKKLSQCLRKPLLPVYSAFPQPSLEAAAAIFYKVYHEKVLPTLGKRQNEQQELWEGVLNSLLSGVLDFLDESESGNIHPRTLLQTGSCAYTLLADSAAMHNANQHTLRDDQILGGRRFGATIWRTKDFLPLESLLTLFARLLPSTKGTASGRAKRTAFIQSVFIKSSPPETTSIGQKISELLENVPSEDWDVTSRKIAEALAADNLTFPQPFAIGEVCACGQTQRCDRLYVDAKAILVNVLIEDEQYESLTISYTSIRKLDVLRERSGEERVGAQVQIVMYTPPILGGEPIASGVDKSGPVVTFTLKSGDLGRFANALRNRGQGQKYREILPPKLSLATSPPVLDFDTQGKPMKQLSQSERIENVQQFYNTNQSSDELDCGSDSDNATKSLKVSSSKPKTEDPLDGPAKTSPLSKARSNSPTAAISEVDLAADSLCAGAAVPSRSSAVDERQPMKSTPHIRSRNVRREAFGASDEELSDLSDIDSVLLAPPQRRRRSEAPRAAVISTRSAKSPKYPLAGKTRSSASRKPLDSDDVALLSGDYQHSAKTATKTAISAINGEVDAVSSITLVHSSAGRAPDTRAEALEQQCIPKDNKRGEAQRNIPEERSPHIAKISPPNKHGYKPSTHIPASGPPALVSTSNAQAMASRLSGDVFGTPSAKTVDAKTINLVSLPATDDPANPAASRRAYIAIDNMKIGGMPGASSPSTAVIQSERTSVKSKLRRKNEALAKLTNNSVPAKAYKRKRDSTECSEDVPNSDKLAEDAVANKRSKTGRSALCTPVPPERTESQVLRPRSTAATRATKRYRGKKEKTSSFISCSHKIDYDALPESDPASSTRNTSSPLTALSARRKKANNKPAPESKAPQSSTTKGRPDKAKLRKTKPSPQDPIVYQKTSDDDPLCDRHELSDTFVEDEPIEETKENQSEVEIETHAKHVVPALAVSASTTDKRRVEMSAPALQEKAHPSSGSTNIAKARSTSKKTKIAPWANLTSEASHRSATEDNSTSGVPGVHHEDTIQPTLNTSGRPSLSKRSMSSSASKSLLTGSGNAHAVPLPEPATVEESMSAVSEVANKAVANPMLETNTTPRSSRMHSPAPLVIPSPAKLEQTDFELTGVTSIPMSKVVEIDDRAGDSVSTRKARPRHSVTFAPVVEEREPSPELNIEAGSRSQPASLSPYKRERATVSPRQLLQDIEHEPFVGRRERGSFRKTDIKGAGSHSRRKEAAANVEDIADVLQELQQAILDKITNRLDGVREEVRIGRSAILQEAAQDLMQMRADSVAHFNRLIDLEAEYASFGRAVAGSLEEWYRTNEEICCKIEETIKSNDRTTIVGRMPAVLVEIPASLRQ